MWPCRGEVGGRAKMTREAGERDPTTKRALRRPEVDVGNQWAMASASAVTFSRLQSSALVRRRGSCRRPFVMLPAPTTDPRLDGVSPTRLTAPCLCREDLRDVRPGRSHDGVIVMCVDARPPGQRVSDSMCPSQLRTVRMVGVPDGSLYIEWMRLGGKLEHPPPPPLTCWCSSPPHVQPRRCRQIFPSVLNSLPHVSHVSGM